VASCCPLVAGEGAELFEGIEPVACEPVLTHHPVTFCHLRLKAWT
jgi:hypothetical protein